MYWMYFLLLYSVFVQKLDFLCLVDIVLNFEILLCYVYIYIFKYKIVVFVKGKQS